MENNSTVPVLPSSLAIEMGGVFTSLGQLFFALDGEKRILDSNWMAQLRLGYLADNLKGQYFHDLFPIERREEIKIALWNMKVGEKKTFSFPLVTRDANLIPTETSIIYQAGEGAEALFFAVCMDHSEIKKIEETLQIAQQQLAYFTSSVSEYLWSMETDLAGKIRIRSLSPGFEKITAFPVPPFLSGEMDLSNFLSAEDLPLYQEAVQRRIISGASEEIEYRILCADGRVRWGRDRLKNRRIADNRVFLDGIVSDITEQKQAELSLHQANEQLRLWISELRQRNSEVVMLNEMGDMLQSAMSVQNAYSVVGQFSNELFVDCDGGLYIVNPETQTLDLVAAWGKNPPVETGFTPDACWGLRRGQIQTFQSPNQKIRCQHVPVDQEMNYLCVPMLAQTETLGFLHIRGKTGQPVDHLKQLALMVTGRVGLALSNLRLSETLRSQSIRDGLTGLFNRRYMEEMMARELHRAIRYHRPLSVIMMDIDHFKNFNDSYGHLAGDAILREMGRVIQSQIRREDIACRYGGEEFVIILTEASVQDTVARAERIRLGVKELSVHHGSRVLEGISISLGVAGFPPNGNTPQDLIETADAALYRAKREGRDRVMVAD